MWAKPNSGDLEQLVTNYKIETNERFLHQIQNSVVFSQVTKENQQQYWSVSGSLSFQ